MTTFLATVLVNDGYAGTKQILHLCFDHLSGKVLAVHPQGYFNFFAKTHLTVEEAMESVECYLAGQHQVDPGTALRIEGLRTFMANRGWDNGVKLLELLCSESHRDQAFGDEFLYWVENGSTLRLFDLVRKVESCARKMLAGYDGPYPYDNAVYGLDAASGYLPGTA